MMIGKVMSIVFLKPSARRVFGVVERMGRI